jgi:hypothetical protein
MSRSGDDANERAAAQKLLAKQLRRKAYLQATERHAKDPRVIAMKEAMKQKRREIYQQAKEKQKVQRKAVARAEKSQREQQRAGERAASDAALRQLIQKGSAGVSKLRERPVAEERESEQPTPSTDVPVTHARKPGPDSYGPN